MPDRETSAGSKVLVLFSGGKDSFLTAARLTEKFDKVVLFSLNNGSEAGEKNLLHGAKRLENRYGPGKISYAGIYCTAALIRQLEARWQDSPAAELGALYPDLTGTQAMCLRCQTAMWAAAIAYARAKGIGSVAAGYKSSDEFCTGTAEWTGRIEMLAGENGIQALFPLWETPEWGENPDFGRNQEMLDRLFEPAVLEPKCLLGRPAARMDGQALASMSEYFDGNLRPQLQDMIDRLENIFRYIRLSPESLDCPDYAVPDPLLHGLF